MGGFSGLAKIRKPAGRTSFAALAPIKRAAASGKVGHAGTLDRFATGLLVVLVGGYSRLCPWFTALDKRYRARIRFGSETDTLDPEGSVLARAELPSLSALHSALPAFRGPLMQKPPLYSALHVDGRRASERARDGEVLDLPARPVTISSLELLDFSGDEAVIEVTCSSGTYIRSLARDLAASAGSRAHLVELERLSIGPLSLAEAVDPDAFEPGRDLETLEPGLAQALGFSVASLPDSQLRIFRNGGRIRTEVLGLTESASGRKIAVFAGGGDFLGLVEGEAPYLSYVMVLGDGRPEEGAI